MTSQQYTFPKSEPSVSTRHCKQSVGGEVRWSVGQSVIQCCQHVSTDNAALSQDGVQCLDDTALSVIDDTALSVIDDKALSFTDDTHFPKMVSSVLIVLSIH